MASVDKVKVGSTSYDISPSKDGTLNGFTSNDAASPTAWSAANAITTSDTNSTIFSKITTMIKNVRWLYSKLGTTDFSATGQSTVTGALSALQSGLNGKAASSHSHNASQLPISSSQTNSNSYIPTSALVYSMQQQINSLNDAINSIDTGGSWYSVGASFPSNNYLSLISLEVYRTKLSAKVKISVKCIRSSTLSSGQGMLGVLENVPYPDNGTAYIKDSVTGFTFSASSGRFYLESPFTITLNNSYSTGWMFYYVRQ